MSSAPARLGGDRKARPPAREDGRDPSDARSARAASAALPRRRRTIWSIVARTLSGLRLRLLVALLATSVISLAVAAVALLGPLEQRLREDGISSASAAMTATRPLFARVLADSVDAPDRHALEHYAFMLVRRTKGGEVTVLTDKLETLAYAPDVHTSDFPYRAYHAAKETLRTGQQVRESQAESLTVAQTIRVDKHRFALVVVKRLEYVEAAFKVVESAFLVAAAAGLAIALLLGIGLASRLLRRLERLRDATSSIESDGLEAPLPDDGAHDEIGELSRSFSAMRTRLSRQEAARRAFVATASHELRTPLASLDGMLELLEDDLSDGSLDLDDARIRTEHAREQTRRLSQLATDLLDISRLDSEVQLRREPLELGEISRAVVAEFERAAGKRGVSLLVRPPLGACWAAADPGAVARIVRILIDNSLRFAPPQTAITVVPSCGEEHAEVSVLDEGPGVADEDRERIFERFTRGSASASGFGLGLAIGRELAQRMDGSLELAERGRDAGARFTLRLPLSDHVRAVG